MNQSLKNNDLHTSNNQQITKKNNPGFSTYKATLKDFLKILSKNYFFILFSLFNLFMPFFSTIISALKGPNGLLNVIAIGLSTSFITVFNQLLFLSAIALLFIFRRESFIKTYKNEPDMVKKNNISLIMIIYSLISIVLFIATSMLYIHFSASYNNIVLSTEIANRFILTIAPALLFNGLIYLYILYGIENKKVLSMIYYSIFVGLQFCLIPAFYLGINWTPNFESIGIGLGILISSIITFAIIMIVSYILKMQRKGIQKQEFLLFFKKANNFMWSTLMGTILKVFLIMIISIAVGLGHKQTPISLIVTKIIWYNSLFFCSFLADGVQNVIHYSRIQSFYNQTQKQYNSAGAWWTIAGVVGLLSVIVTAIFDVGAMNLGQLYLSHQIEIIPDSLAGPNPNINEVIQQIKNYLWSPNSGAYNLELFKYNLESWMQLNPNMKPTPEIQQSIWMQSISPCYALMYLSIYHGCISMVKVMTISEIKLDQKFNWKSLLANAIVLILIMTFISVFSIAFKSKGFITLFQGVDAFSFSLMWVSIILLLLKLLPIILKPIMVKKYMKKMQQQKQNVVEQ